ncbi:MAG: APC family permease [Pirellulales bacterium]
MSHPSSGLNPSDSDSKGPATPSTDQLDSTIPQTISEVIETPGGTENEPPSLPAKVKTFLIGRPRDLTDKRIFQHVSLIAFLAWVGLGADGLSSSCYGPSEAFHHLTHTATGSHTYLAIFLSLATIITVFVISACYSHIIEEFPSGGGGYLVASKLLGRPAGVVSGSALLVDYVLTVTVSIAAAGEALFGLLPAEWQAWKIWAEGVAILLLILLNLRGVKESVTFLLPIFLVFLATHALLIAGAFFLHLGSAGDVTRQILNSVQTNVARPEVGWIGLFSVFIYAYSMGAGTYTGIEAVSNSMPVMREPRVATAKRTMLYMAISLAFTAGGLMVVYLLHDIQAVEGKTMNQVLTESFVRETKLDTLGIGSAFLWVTIISEGALLFVAAQAGFIDGPRVLANMSHDSYFPHWFGNLSERLATHHGILLMGGSALAALIYTGGSIGTLVTMYSINVFLTFSLSMIGMLLYWWHARGSNPLWRRRVMLFSLGALLCLSILAVTVYEKFLMGGWVTVGVTGTLVAVCFVTRAYYDSINRRVRALNEALTRLHTRAEDLNTNDPDPEQPTAVILVGGYGGLGIHTMMNALRFTTNYYKNLVFVSVGVVDSGNFKGEEAMDELRSHTEQSLAKYVDLANRFGFPSTSFMAVGTDPVEELEHLCVQVVKRFPKSTIFAGQLIFSRESIFQHLFHNQTAFSLQRRLHWDGVPMVILPTRVR